MMELAAATDLSMGSPRGPAGGGGGHPNGLGFRQIDMADLNHAAATASLTAGSVAGSAGSAAITTTNSSGEQKTRLPNWTEEEKNVLIQEVRLRAAVLTTPRAKGMSHLKEKAWEEITAAVNAVQAPGSQLRNAQTCRKKWENLKLYAKKAQKEGKSDMTLATVSQLIGSEVDLKMLQATLQAVQGPPSASANAQPATLTAATTSAAPSTGGPSPIPSPGPSPCIDAAAASTAGSDSLGALFSVLQQQGMNGALARMLGLAGAAAAAAAAAGTTGEQTASDDASLSDCSNSADELDDVRLSLLHAMRPDVAEQADGRRPSAGSSVGSACSDRQQDQLLVGARPSAAAGPVIAGVATGSSSGLNGPGGLGRSQPAATGAAVLGGLDHLLHAVQQQQQQQHDQQIKQSPSPVPLPPGVSLEPIQKAAGALPHPSMAAATAIGRHQQRQTPTPVVTTAAAVSAATSAPTSPHQRQQQLPQSQQHSVGAAANGFRARPIAHQHGQRQAGPAKSATSSAGSAPSHYVNGDCRFHDTEFNERIEDSNFAQRTIASATELPSHKSGTVSLKRRRETDSESNLTYLVEKRSFYKEITKLCGTVQTLVQSLRDTQEIKQQLLLEKLRQIRASTDQRAQAITGLNTQPKAQKANKTLARSFAERTTEADNRTLPEIPPPTKKFITTDPYEEKELPTLAAEKSDEEKELENFNKDSSEDENQGEALFDAAYTKSNTPLPEDSDSDNALQSGAPSFNKLVRLECAGEQRLDSFSPREDK